jgi:alkylated DNA repair dioxygenase AlkB
VGVQQSLFGREEAGIDLSFARGKRIDLGLGAWIDLVPGWLSGHARLFEELVARVSWRSDERKMYDRVVDVPRLYGSSTEKLERALPILESMRVALDARYGTSFERLTFGYYRDGRDSVAWHGDYVARRMPEAFVATVSVGSPRRFLLRPTGGGKSIGFSLGWGDLVVMGGSCQRTFQHAIPKVAEAGPRIAIMYRPVWRDDGDDTAPREDR